MKYEKSTLSLNLKKKKKGSLCCTFLKIFPKNNGKEFHRTLSSNILLRIEKINKRKLHMVKTHKER